MPTKELKNIPISKSILHEQEYNILYKINIKGKVRSRSEKSHKPSKN